MYAENVHTVLSCPNKKRFCFNLLRVSVCFLEGWQSSLFLISLFSSRKTCSMNRNNWDRGGRGDFRVEILEIICVSSQTELSSLFKIKQTKFQFSKAKLKSHIFGLHSNKTDLRCHGDDGGEKRQGHAQHVEQCQGHKGTSSVQDVVWGRFHKSRKRRYGNLARELID